MAFIAKVSIGQFAPGDTLTGIEAARLDELVKAGYAENDGVSDKPSPAPKSTAKPAAPKE